jgi:hypothetical protein
MWHFTPGKSVFSSQNANEFESRLWNHRFHRDTTDLNACRGCQWDSKRRRTIQYPHSPVANMIARIPRHYILLTYMPARSFQGLPQFGQFGLDLPSLSIKFLADCLDSIIRALSLRFGRQVGGASVALGLNSFLLPSNTSSSRYIRHFERLVGIHCVFGTHQTYQSAASGF